MNTSVSKTEKTNKQNRAVSSRKMENISVQGLFPRLAFLEAAFGTSSLPAVTPPSA